LLSGNKILKKPLDVAPSLTLEELNFNDKYYLEVKRTDDEWRPYKPEEIQLFVAKFDKEKEDWEKEVIIFTTKDNTLGNLKLNLAQKYGIEHSQIRLFKQSSFKIEELKGDNLQLRNYSVWVIEGDHLFVDDSPEIAGEDSLAYSKLKKRLSSSFYKPKEKVLTIKKNQKNL
jgi:hypothetical protein